MKWLVRVLLGLAALLVLAVVALVVLLPKLIDRPEVRERIGAAAKEATGRTLRYEKLGFGLLPPRLDVAGVALEGGPQDTPLRAERISLELALLPLLARTVLVDTLVVRGADLTLTRTPAGIELPIKPPPRAEKEKTGAGEEGGGPGGGVSIAVREVRIEDTRVTLRDRTVRPAVEWVIDALDASARGQLLGDAPIDFDVAAKLAGAPLSAKGSASRAGALDAKLALDAFPLERLGPYLPAGLVLRGTAALELAPKGELEHFSAPLALDLTRAELARGDSFHKPAGDRAAFVGMLVRDGAALRIENGKLDLRDVTLAVTVDLAPKTRVRLDAPRFELAGFGPWLPGLGKSGASGGVALEGLDATFAPLSLRGGIVLDGVNAPVAKTRGRLSGRLEGRGDSLVGDAMELRVAEQVFRLGLVLDSLAKRPGIWVADRVPDRHRDGYASRPKALEKVSHEARIVHPGCISVVIGDGDWHDREPARGGESEGAGAKGKTTRAGGCRSLRKHHDTLAAIDHLAQGRERVPSRSGIVAVDEDRTREPSRGAKQGPCGDLDLGEEDRGHHRHHQGNVDVRSVVGDDHAKPFGRLAFDHRCHSEQTHEQSREAPVNGSRQSLRRGRQSQRQSGECVRGAHQQRDREEASQGSNGPQRAGAAAKNFGVGDFRTGVGDQRVLAHEPPLHDSPERPSKRTPRQW
jgi:hypothetical protein